MADTIKAHWDIATAIAWLCWRNEAICRRVATQKKKEFLDVDVAAALEEPVRKILINVKAKDELLTALEADKLRGRGTKISGKGDFEEIQPYEWAFLRFSDNPFRAEPNHSQDSYSNSWNSVLFPSKRIRCLWPSTPKSRRVGSPPKFPWPVFYEAVNVFLREHGLPRPDKPKWRKVTLENLMDEWCDENWSDRKGPGESTIRVHVTAAMVAFEKGIKRKADK